MITGNNIVDLNNIVLNLAYKDSMEAYKKSARYKKGRYTKTGKERKFEGYKLSDETEEAFNLLTLATSGEISKEDEEIIKAYLLKTKLLNENLIKANYMVEFYKGVFKNVYKE